MTHSRALGLVLAAALVGCGASAHPSTTPPISSAPSATATTEGAPIESTITGLGGAFVASMEVARTSFGAATLRTSGGGDAVYVAGGYFGEPHRYSREGQSTSFARLTAANTWEELAPLDIGLQGLALVPLGDDLVRCGGSRIDNVAGDPTDMHSVTTCMRYRVATNAWEAFPPLPEARSSFDMVSVGERIYAIGGWTIDGDTQHTTFGQTMFVYENGAWTAQPAPIQRRALAVAATPRQIVVVGGLTPELAASNRVDLLDVTTGAWSQGPDFPGEGFGLSAIGDGEVVYASGSDGMVYRYAPGATSWTPIRSLVIPRFFHRLMPRDGSLLAIGGIGSMTTDGRARLVEAVALTGESPRASWVDFSFPGSVRNRAGMFVQGDSIFVFGGNNSPEQHDFAPTNFVSEGFRLHVPSLRWFATDALPEGRQSLESIVVGEGAIAIGGFGHDDDAPRTYPDAFVTAGDGHWRLVRGVIPEARTQFGSAVYDGAVWIFGGLSYDDALPEEERFTHLASVLRCPLNAEAVASGEGAPLGPCEQVAEMPGTRRAFASTALDGRFYIMGGMRDGFAAIDDCFVFDFASRQFSPLTCPSQPRISATLLPYEGRLYLVGGSSRTETGLGPDGSVEVLDPATGTWSRLVESLPFSTHQGRWMVLHGRLVMLATQADANHATLGWVDPTL